ncbi:hypothetical protein HCG60_10895 [Ligilactobacillus murinus]|uniref:hypothetical protein n=1 Tax=Ligilactobacillus murinus TaxID=1622 RepID=UPI001C8CF029|nr:hypothetical protein [Ligilactobacillus murinus]MBX9013525.1 hypothetical protein [Ligilactobacillus murinus]
MQTVEQVKKRIDYLLERDQATEAEIEKVYSQAVDTLRAIVSDVHNRYAVDGVVVPANLYGKVTVKDMLLLKQQYDKLPDDLSASEQDRVDYYTAMSQTSPKGLITALVGLALIAVVHKVGKIIDKNNRTAVKEEIAYQAKYEDIPKMSVKKYASSEFEVKTGKDFVPWTERVLTDHDQAVNRISNVINSMVSQGMRAEDIADHFYPGNAKSMRADNIPKIIRDATVKAKRTARTEAAAREDAIVEQTFKANNVKYFDWVTEPGACQKCMFLALSGPYKVGDEASPRVPESSHPNCRCRRLAGDESIGNDKMTALLAGAVSANRDENDLGLQNSNKDDDFEVVEDVRSLPVKPDKGGRPNAKIILYRGGKAESIRIYDSKGYAYRDYDLTNHGNSKNHPVVPHVHDWIVDSVNGKIRREKWREPTDEEIKFIEGAIEYGDSRQTEVDK